MKTLIGIYGAVEDGFQRMPDYQYFAFLAGTIGLMFIIGLIISMVAAVLPFPGMR